MAEHVRGGYPEVTFDRLTGSPPGATPGGEVEVADTAGQTVGWGLWDTADGKIRILDRDPSTSLNDGFLRQRIQAAQDLRSQLGLPGADTVYRIMNAEGDGLPGVTVDRYGDYLLLCTASPDLATLVERLIPVLRTELSPSGIVHKIRPRQGSGAAPRTILHGEAPPRRLEVTAGGGPPLEVHLRGGVNTGLFLDLRDERTWLEQNSAGRRVLHTFSYSGNLSVSLARGGAEHITLVDSAPGMHAWAARNLRLAGCDPGDVTQIRFIQGEVLEAMDQLAAQGDCFGLVLLDAPTYSAARPSHWSLKRHLPVLVTKGLALVDRCGGTLWIAVNSRRHRQTTVENWIQKGLAAGNRAGHIAARRGLPSDHPTIEHYSRGHYLKIFEVAVRACDSPPPADHMPH